MQTCSPERFDSSWGGAATCQEGHLLECKRRVAAPGTNQTPAWISSCAKGLAPLSCDGYFPAACEAPAGQLADDSPCFFSSQCRGRLCSKTGDSECGRCRTLVTEGDGCALNQDCLPPLTCQAGKCHPQPLRGEGEACNEFVLFCRYPLVCFGRAGGGGTDGTCAQRLQLGATCPSSLDAVVETCDTEKGLFCDPVTTTCRPFTPLPGLGQACPGGTCSGSGTCDGSKCVPRARVGESCERKQCLEPAFCADIVGKNDMECLLVQPDVCK
jgi:hypothetical protein